MFDRTLERLSIRCVGRAFSRLRSGKAEALSEAVHLELTLKDLFLQHMMDTLSYRNTFVYKTEAFGRTRTSVRRGLNRSGGSRPPESGGLHEGLCSPKRFGRPLSLDFL